MDKAEWVVCDRSMVLFAITLLRIATVAVLLEVNVVFCNTAPLVRTSLPKY